MTRVPNQGSPSHYPFRGRALVLTLCIVVLGCAAETEPVAVDSDHAAAIPGWDRFSYARCMAVLEHLQATGEHAQEVQLLFEEVNDEGIAKANTLCGQVADTLSGMQLSLATAAANPAVSARALLLILMAGVAIGSVSLLKSLIGGMAFNPHIETDAELGMADLLTAYDAAWHALPLETQTSLEPRKTWLRDSIVVWYRTFQNSQQARRQPPDTKNCYAVAFGDSPRARDINEYAASPCAEDVTCETTKQQVFANLSLLEATPTLGIYYNECLHQLGFFTPSP
ncbi:MAG: hypothetical protein H6714_08530 [Myxococcales bacterium]|nr:hypothetical protein [Myxococcales bacterium]